MKNLEKSYTRLPILLPKISCLLTKLNKIYTSTPINNVLQSAFTQELHKLISAPTTPEFDNEAPVYLEEFTNNYWDKLLKSLVIDISGILTEFEDTETYATQRFNDLNSRISSITMYARD
jgi:hypothetical protein